MDEPFHGPENQREVQVPIKRQEFTAAAATVEKFSLVTMNSFPRIFQARELDYLLQRLITVTWIKMYVFQKKIYWNLQALFRKDMNQLFYTYLLLLHKIIIYVWYENHKTTLQQTTSCKLHSFIQKVVIFISWSEKWLIELFHRNTFVCVRWRTCMIQRMQLCFVFTTMLSASAIQKV